MLIRRADGKDGPSVIQTLRASITELCIEDHQSDPERLGVWLSNKTLEMYQTWLQNPQRLIWVCMQEETCRGMAMATTDGEVLLNYVAPAARFQGLSSALLETVESHLWRSGCSELTLWSTQTAHQFYLSRGWQPSGPAVEEDGMMSYPMKKTCSSNRPDLS